MFSKIKNLFNGESKSVSDFYNNPGNGYYILGNGKAVWSDRCYQKFADEAFRKNIVAYRAISMIADSAANVKFKLKTVEDNDINIDGHPILELLTDPNPSQSGFEFFRNIYSHRLISRNSYILSVGASDEQPAELYNLRPDRVSVLASNGGCPAGYRYQVKGGKTKDYLYDRAGQCQVLHVKNFHPLNDWYGMSPIEAAAYSIDQHNQAANWNQALMQNGARPSGALVVKNEGGNDGKLGEDTYHRLKAQIEEQFTGSANAGRLLLLEGGLDWKEMSLSPKDMDFIESKNSSARDIALAFGMPPQLLGIPGDSTYNNLAEARLALWEQTIIPLVEEVFNHLNNWLIPQFDDRLKLEFSLDNIPALAPRREAIWKRVNDANFLSDEEKRKILGI